jgi:hypothetical protein
VCIYKLVRQRRTLFGLGATALVPVLIVAALAVFNADRYRIDFQLIE